MNRYTVTVPCTSTHYDIHHIEAATKAEALAQVMLDRQPDAIEVGDEYTPHFHRAKIELAKTEDQP